MSFDENGTHYDVLHIHPDAAPHEVRDAYVRIKGTYTRDSAALYTLVSPEEREQTLVHIEEAYQVLSNPERRREYDKLHGLLNNDFLPGNVVSIDRVPPMDPFSGGDDLLIAPSTEISEAEDLPIGIRQAPAAPPPPAPQAPQPPPPLPPPPAPAARPPSPPRPTKPPQPSKPSLPFATPLPPSGPKRSPDLPLISQPLDPQLLQELENEREWHGRFLRKVREGYRISLEEMAATTKISKTYISAIEEENFARLPAPVYVRGFVAQVARVLRLPPEPVANAFLGRMKAWQANP